jgi:propionate CoA-transferase
VVFCCTFTVKGLEGTFDGRAVHITHEGSVKKFVPRVSALSFSEKNAHANGQDILYITERCVFALGERGLVLTEIAPGIDLHRDILDLLDFDVEVAENLKEMEF